MERQQAITLLENKVKTLNLIKHCFACEAAMRELARYFQEDEEKWGLAGLLHDIDYEETKNNPKEHSLLGAKYLEEQNMDKEIIEAVKTHNEIHGLVPESRMGKALFCIDPLTGLIVATTLILPSKKIDEVSVDNVLNRFKERAFARGANRAIIQKCEELLGLTLEEFTELVLKGMKSVAQDLGL